MFITGRERLAVTSHQAAPQLPNTQGQPTDVTTVTQQSKAIFTRFKIENISNILLNYKNTSIISLVL